MGHTTGAKSSLIMEKWYKIRYNDGDQEELTHTQTTKVNAYIATAFTAGYGPALSAILRDIELQTNLAFKDLRDVQDVDFSVTHPITGKEMEWK